MLDRPPPADDAKARKREQARERQRRKRWRDREREGGTRYEGVAPPVVVEALILRSIDAGMSEEAAERASRSRRKVSADLAEINLQWAVRYISERSKRA